ncbi:putative sulfurtransferase DsrE [compost metagenome]
MLLRDFCFIIPADLLKETSMKFAIAVFSPAHAPSSRRALRFAQAALAGGHEIVRLFFYQDGVHSASGNVVTPQDELDLPTEWRAFVSAQQLDAVVCIAAALRRGVLNAEEAQRYQRPAVNLPAPWELSGLGQLHEAAQVADRLMCFGGD